MQTLKVSVKKLPVLVTRPASQAEEICPELEALGCEVIRQPMLKIDAVAETAKIKSQFMDIDLFDAVIAISRNAAEMGLMYLDQYWPQWPLGVDWIAIGPVTAAVMQAQGLETKMPSSQFDSEGALNMPELQNVAGKKILIWRGVGGRETLASTLRERGAEVKYAELYQRLIPEYDEQQWQQALALKPLLLVSSGQGLEAIAAQQPKIADSVRGIIAPSSRVAKLAKSLGFGKIQIATSAQDVDMLGAVKKWIATSQ
ncbi:MAG: uroporphyrinogen-III synthase [Oleispira sp.]|nr:uroporphyrinogen-III synthase [Oleispira sp.]MBL4880995.1 uroporphyrinogen-III synthase [Oleispira sp.]